MAVIFLKIRLAVLISPSDSNSMKAGSFHVYEMLTVACKVETCPRRACVRHRSPSEGRRNKLTVA